ncbi:hypothetical protein SUGI_0894920 [Cryptomeria japonica]|uniref:nuclear pore complex protein NUP35 n=1 Tax=Cryptomeria japonica TaxID=3369 RepID=UPI002414B356|nr:nuclear pore complex protein NUP35 [Cryptomeria japonica]GLJ43124.1 hypothetical protein SUGI_0894920 [Cryptomeria japonica]
MVIDRLIISVGAVTVADDTSDIQLRIDKTLNPSESQRPPQRVSSAAADPKAGDEKSKISVCGALKKRESPSVAMAMDFTSSTQRSSSRRGASHSRFRFYRDLASPVKIDFSSHPQNSPFSGSWLDGPPPPPTRCLDDQVEDASPTAHQLKTPPPKTNVSASAAASSSVSFRRSTPPDEAGSFGRGFSFQTPGNPIRRSPLFPEGDKENESPQNDRLQQEPRGLLELPPLEEAERPHSQTNGAVDGQCWVTVYGFSPQDTNLVLREFEKCGTILKHVSGPEGANFVHILYENIYDAQKALQKNGAQISSSLMVGVKPMDSFQSQTFTEKAKTGFMVLPPRSPGKAAASTLVTKASSRPYYLQQSNERGQRFSGAIASPSKSTILRIVDLIFGV